MADNKSQRWDALTHHVMVYTFVLLFGTMLWQGLHPSLVAFIITNGLLHFGTDAITSRCTRQLKEKGNIHGFFTVIGFDQFIHTTCLYLTAQAFF